MSMDNRELVRRLRDGIGCFRPGVLCHTCRLLSEAAAALESAEKTLAQAVEVIKEWHNMPTGRSSFADVDMEDTWRIYYENAPEMKPIRAALSAKGSS